MKPFDYRRPESVEEAAAALGKDGEGRLLAGGMTLIPAIKHGLATPSALIDLSGIALLRGISRSEEGILVGAMTTHASVAGSSLLREVLPSLAGLAGGIGDPQVRHRGTLGGSVANNDPAADYPAACLGLGATIVTDRRRLVSDKFFTGFFSTALAPSEVLTSILFPVPKRAAYVKFANPASRYAMVGAFVAQFERHVRVAVTGAGRAGVFRIGEMEQALETEFSPQSLPAHSVPLEDLNSDLHASADYRSHLINVLVKRAVGACLGIPAARPTRHGGAVAY